MKQNVSISWSKCNGLWRRGVPGEDIEESVVMIVAKENWCGFSADGALLLRANDVIFVWARNALF